MHAIVVSSEEVVGVEEEPTGAQADSDAALMAELNQICAIQEKLYEEEFGYVNDGHFWNNIHPVSRAFVRTDFCNPYQLELAKL